MKKRTAAMDYLLLIAGAFIMGFAIKNIYDPLNLVTGGVSGLAIVIKSKVGVPLWLTNTLLNIPLFLASFVAGLYSYNSPTAKLPGYLPSIN